MKNIMRIAAIVLCMTMPVAAITQNVSFTASVSKSKIALNERFTLSLTLNNAANNGNFNPPDMRDFIVLGGPNQSMSFSNINGNVSQSITYNYVLQARNPGTFTIGAASVKVGKQVYSTEPITIEVSDNPVTQNTNPNNSGNQGQNNSDASEDVNDYISQNAFVRTEVSKSEVYKGESISVTQKLYVKANASIYGYRVLQLIQAPKFDGFYVHEIDVPESSPQQVTYNGETYNVSTLRKLELTPQRAGTLTLDPSVYDVLFGIRVTRKENRSNDPFDQMFNDFFSDPFNSSAQQVRASVASVAEKIKVDDLPPGAPASFAGAVGKYSVQSTLSNTTAKTDEPLTYRLTISGTGNLGLFNAPQLNLPPDWETYDPKVSSSQNAKTFEYLLIPRSPGDFTIPAYTLSYFDPAQKQYQTASTDAYPVHVDAGPGYTQTTNTYEANKEDVQALATDIRFIKKGDPEYVAGENTFFGSPIFYTGMGLPFLLGLSFLFIAMRRKQLENDVAGMRNRKAKSIAQKRLSKARRLAAEGSGKLFYEEVVRTIWGYLGNKLNMVQSELSKENIRTYLLHKKVQETTADHVITLLNTCELAVFAPQQQEGSLMDTYNDAVSLIAQLEEEIRK